FEIMPKPPIERAESTPWPTYPLMYRVSSAHEEGGERVYSVNTEEFIGSDGKVTALKAHEVVMRDGRFEKVEGSEFELECDLVLFAMGFVGPERGDLLDKMGVEYDQRGNIKRDDDFAAIGQDGVFVAGDAGRGQSLIVWAIAEGRSAAAAADAYLAGRSDLPAPIVPTQVAQR
ncbi:MAG: FAD-dependent oxidoreductase, partial [Mycobacterium sp.]|nr:FAD-dependent oxidoreductase [Mycobacterium sp.]